MAVNYHEIIFLFSFFLVAVIFIKGKGTKKGIREFLFFSLPIILFLFFIEFFWLFRESGEYNLDKFSVSFFKVPLIVPLTWVTVVFFSKWFTKKTFQRNEIIKKENFLLSLGDGLWSVFFAVLIFEPLGHSLDLWRHMGIKPFLFGAPFWYFIGWFLAVFLVSFCYRIFKETRPPKKRFLLSFLYISFFIFIRAFFYFVFNF